MRLFLVLIMIILSRSVFANELRPCQMVAYDKLIEYTIPEYVNLYQSQNWDNDKLLIKEALNDCIKYYSVCFIAVSPIKKWFSKKLVRPNNNRFDPTTRDLIYGVIQYKDNQTGQGVCIAVKNGFVNAEPFYGASWTIDGNKIREYQISSAQFNPSIMPKKMYRVMLETHQEAVADAKEAERPDAYARKLIRVKGLLAEGRDPYILASIFNISIEEVKALQKSIKK